jgi:hypothetical protein
VICLKGGLRIIEKGGKTKILVVQISFNPELGSETHPPHEINACYLSTA